MSLVKNKPQEKTAYLSRESLKKEAERISRKSTATSAPQPEVQKTETPQEPMERIAEMSRKLAYLSAENAKEAQKDERVSLLTAATLEMCRILQDFLTTIRKEMQLMSDKEMKNLNIQELYAKSVETSIYRTARAVYNQVETEQKNALDNVTKYISDTNDRMEKQIEICTAEVRKATKYAVRSADRLRRLKTIGDMLYFSAPILVLIDIIMRVIAVLQ